MIVYDCGCALNVFTIWVGRGEEDCQSWQSHIHKGKIYPTTSSAHIQIPFTHLTQKAKHTKHNTNGARRRENVFIWLTGSAAGLDWLLL